MGIEFKTKERGEVADLAQVVTADDFDNCDHNFSPKDKNHVSLAHSQEAEELNRQRAAHISGMEQKLTDRINLLLEKKTRSDTDEWELQDAYKEAKPLRALQSKLGLMQSTIHQSEDEKKSQSDSFSALNQAMDGVKKMVDDRK